LPKCLALALLGALVVHQAARGDEIATNTPTQGALTNANAAARQSASGTGAEPTPTAKMPLQPPKLAPNVAEVVNLAQSGVGEAVILEFIRNSPTPFELTADEIVYLKDLGISETVLAEMLRHRQGAGAPETTAPAAASSAPTVAAPVPAPETNAAPLTSTASPPAATAPPPVYTETVTRPDDYFYASLSPYGTWLDLPPYGWVWQPTCAVVVADWRPYCHGGGWVYSDRGWYWRSTYTWGWAPFHYGNWHRHSRCGWVWVPGHVWSPAWVTWRYSDAYCGWAPLPPGCGWSTGVGLTFRGSAVGVSFGFGLGHDYFTFVGYNHFCEPAVHHHRVSHDHAFAAYNRSKVVNHYSRGQDNIVVNRGIPPERITAVTHREIRKVALHDVASAGDAVRRADRFARDGKSLAVYRPDPRLGTPGPRVVPEFRQRQARANPPDVAEPERGLPRTGHPQTTATTSKPGMRTSPRAPESPGRAPAPTAGGVPSTAARDGAAASSTQPQRGPQPSGPGSVAPGSRPRPDNPASGATAPSPTRTGSDATGAPTKHSQRSPAIISPNPTSATRPGPTRSAAPHSATSPARTYTPPAPTGSPGHSPPRNYSPSAPNQAPPSPSYSRPPAKSPPSAGPSFSAPSSRQPASGPPPAASSSRSGSSSSGSRREP
jgi:hypothetical protein